MPRQARLDTAGTLHHVETRGVEDGAIFRNGTGQVGGRRWPVRA